MIGNRFLGNLVRRLRHTNVGSIAAAESSGPANINEAIDRLKKYRISEAVIQIRFIEPTRRYVMSMGVPDTTFLLDIKGENEVCPNGYFPYYWMIFKSDGIAEYIRRQGLSAKVEDMTHK